MNNISVTFLEHSTIAVAPQSLWQWDYGQNLMIDGLDLPSEFDVHFCCAGDSSTIPKRGSNNQVEIPDSCVEQGRTIYGYIFLHESESDGETVCKIVIKVKRREKPPGEKAVTVEDYEIADGMISFYHEATGRIILQLPLWDGSVSNGT